MEEEKSAAAKIEKVAGSYSFAVEGWSGVSNEVGESTESPEFELCGKTWQLRIFPGGSLEAHRGHVSFYLASKSSTTTRASYKLIIKNQAHNGKDEEFASTGIRKFEAKGVQIDGWGRDRYISSSKLKDPWNALCVDDIVLFRVEVTVYGGLCPIPQSTCIDGDPVPTLAESLDNAMEKSQETFADLTVQLVNGDAIPAHKCILAARSPIFQAMLAAPMSESIHSTITIEEIDAAVVKQLLKFMYTDIIR